MKSIKICIVLVIASILLLMTAAPFVSADETYVIDDEEDDVVITTLDGLDMDSELTKTSDKPNLDITKVTYFYSEADNEITLTLEVKGVIEDKNDFSDEMDLNTSLFGSLIQYLMIVELSNNTYDIQYSDENCTVNGVGTEDYTVSGSTFSVTFDHVYSDEAYVATSGNTMEVNITSLEDFGLYLDVAPDSAFFVADTDVPSSGETGEAITFEGSYQDLFGITSGPYTYTWDFDDGSSSQTGESVSHTYQYAGTYNVELTVQDGGGNEATAETTIVISQGDNGSTNNGGNGNGDDNNSDDGSSFMLFVGVVVLIIIIGVVALVFVIRR